MFFPFFDSTRDKSLLSYCTRSSYTRYRQHRLRTPVKKTATSSRARYEFFVSYSIDYFTRVVKTDEKISFRFFVFLFLFYAQHFARSVKPDALKRLILYVLKLVSIVKRRCIVCPRPRALKSRNSFCFSYKSVGFINYRCEFPRGLSTRRATTTNLNDK